MIDSKNLKDKNVFDLRQGDFFVAQNSDTAFIGAVTIGATDEIPTNIIWYIPLVEILGGTTIFEPASFRSLGGQPLPKKVMVIKGASVEVDFLSIEQDPAVGYFVKSARGDGILSKAERTADACERIRDGRTNDYVPTFFSRWGIRVGDQIIEIESYLNASAVIG